MTSRGFKEEDMVKVAKLIRMTAKEYPDAKDTIIAEVQELCDAHPIY